MVDNRNFHHAILASLALHALLLAAFPDLARPTRAVRVAPPLVAHLVEPAPIEPQPVRPPAAAPEAPRIEKPKPQKPKPVVQAPELPAVPAPAVPAVPAIEPSFARAPQPSAAPVPAPAPPGPVSRIEAPQVASAETVSRDQYRLQLIDEARRYKRYPPLARENNWQGDVHVGVAVGTNGRATVTLKGSSGYDVLDRQALEMFRQATRTVAIPPALRGKEFALDVRAVYGLED